MKQPTIEVYVGNYGSYAAGRLIDRQIGLPAPVGEIDKMLADMQEEAERIVGSPCEEFYISDYTENALAGCGELFTEHNDIHALNMMAAQLACMSDDEVARAAAYISNLDSPEIGYEAAMNVLLQADEVPYHDYGWGEYAGSDMVYKARHDGASPEERFGYMLLDGNPDLKGLLESDPMIEAAFDVEEYGRQVEMASNVVLLEDGYIDKDEDFDLSYYDAPEIEACVMENMYHHAELDEVRESLTQDREQRDLNELRREIVEGNVGLYSPAAQTVVANMRPGAPDGHGAAIGIYTGELVSPARASVLAHNGVDIAQYCRDNHLLKTIGQDKWDELAPDMAYGGSGWCNSAPESTLAALRDPVKVPERPQAAKAPVTLEEARDLSTRAARSIEREPVPDLTHGQSR